MSIVLHHSRASGTAKVVLLGIANHDGDGGAWPAIGTLMKYANVTRGNVQKAIARLEELGEIRRHRQDGGTASMLDHLRPNRYEITLRCPPGCDRSNRHIVAAPQSVVFEPGEEPGELIEGPWGIDSEAPRGIGSEAPPGIGSEAQTIPTEPSMKHPVYRRPAAIATDAQKKYIRHMQSILGEWASNADPDQLTCEEADGWIGAWMGDYRAAGGGRDKHTEVWNDEDRQDAAF